MSRPEKIEDIQIRKDGFTVTYRTAVIAFLFTVSAVWGLAVEIAGFRSDIASIRQNSFTLQDYREVQDTARHQTPPIDLPSAPRHVSAAVDIITTEPRFASRKE